MPPFPNNPTSEFPDAAPGEWIDQVPENNSEPVTVTIFQIKTDTKAPPGFQVKVDIK